MLSFTTHLKTNIFVRMRFANRSFKVPSSASIKTIVGGKECYVEMGKRLPESKAETQLAIFIKTDHNTLEGEMKTGSKRSSSLPRVFGPC